MTAVQNFLELCNREEYAAFAGIRGNASHPNINGSVLFYPTPYNGILIAAEVFGLPEHPAFLGMHIHETGDCTPPFDKTGMHYNPTNQSHPNHAGDLLPLLNNQGYAFLTFYDERLSIPDSIGKSVIIHANRDDFTTPPSGDSGEKIGCGVIMKV